MSSALYLREGLERFCQIFCCSGVQIQASSDDDRISEGHHAKASSMNAIIDTNFALQVVDYGSRMWILALFPCLDATRC